MADRGPFDLKFARSARRRAQIPIVAAGSGHGISMPGVADSAAAVHFGEPFALPAHKSDDLRSRIGESEARLRLLMAAHFDFVWRSLRRLGLLDAEADD